MSSQLRIEGRSATAGAAASPARTPMRSSPLARAEPHSIYNPPKNRSLQHLPPPYYQQQPAASTSAIPAAHHSTPRKLLKRVSAPPSPAALRRPPSSASLYTQGTTLTTRLKTVDGVEKICTFNAPEIPRFHRMGLENRNVVMPLSKRQYQIKKRRESLAASPIPRPQPAAAISPSDPRRRGLSFAHIDRDALLWEGLWRDNEEDAAMNDTADLRMLLLSDAQYRPPRRVPSSTRSSSSESTSDTFPFTPSISSFSSIPTISEPATPAFQQPYSSISLVGDKLAPHQAHHHHYPSLSLRGILRSFQTSSDTASTWSGEDAATTCNSSEMSASNAPAPTIIGESDTETTPKRKRATRTWHRLLRTFSSSKRVSD